MRKRRGPKPTVMSSERPPVPDEILEFVRALARLQAKRDHDREMDALAERRRALKTAGIVFLAEDEQTDGGPGVRLKKSI